jgi:hypothetical protein
MRGGIPLRVFWFFAYGGFESGLALFGGNFFWVGGGHGRADLGSGAGLELKPLDSAITAGFLCPLSSPRTPSCTPPFARPISPSAELARCLDIPRMNIDRLLQPEAPLPNGSPRGRAGRSRQAARNQRARRLNLPQLRHNSQPAGQKISLRSTPASAVRKVTNGPKR